MLVLATWNVSSQKDGEPRRETVLFLLTHARCNHPAASEQRAYDYKKNIQGISARSLIYLFVLYENSVHSADILSKQATDTLM